MGLRVFSPDGEPLHSFEATATFRDEQHVVNLIDAAQLELPVAGAYRVQVLARGVVLMERRLTVQVPAPGA